MSKTRKIIITILIALIILTVYFIWSRSISGKEESSSFSGGVYNQSIEIIKDIFGEKISIKYSEIITHPIFRKLAHFFEFMVLGIESSFLYICLFF